uniref:Uncharacterized protein n=1 Tax=Globodera rostochiensis TaxID=31243 RepID=A0A914HIG9_GLORO
MQLIVALIFLFTILAHLNCCSGLRCKIGHFSSNRLSENSTIETCPAEAQYCLAITCTKGGAQAFASIEWTCEKRQNNKRCAEIMHEAYKNLFGYKNVYCDCNYGEKGKSLENAQFVLPPVPPTTPKKLECKIGKFDAKGYGMAWPGFCLGHYCYMASCAKANNETFMRWGCSETNRYSEIVNLFGEQYNSKMTCHCLFGKMDADETNVMNMLPPLLPMASTVTRPPAVMPTKSTENASSQNTAAVHHCILILFMIASAIFHDNFLHLGSII